MVMLCQVCEYTYYLLPSASLALCSLADLDVTVKKAGPQVESPMHCTRHISTNLYVSLNCVTVCYTVMLHNNYVYTYSTSVF